MSVLKNLERMQEQLSVNGIVFHLDVIDNFDILADSPIKTLIENMDSRKKLKTDVTFFRKLKEDYNFGFVLDLEHAYEHDNEMGLAKDLILVMDDRLSHLHVSGCSEKEIHSPLYLSKNKDKISRVLELKLQIPKILEGLLSGNIQKTTSDELSFIKSYC